MNYSIGEVSRMFDLPASTLRYYDKEGLLPHIQRQGTGIRRFDQQTIEALRVIECLKKSGMEIKDIKQFMDWCVEGASTYPLRRELLEKQRKTVEAEIAHMNKVLDMLRFKCWYYDQAIQDGSEDRIKSLLPDHLPDDIQPLYDHAHQ